MALPIVPILEHNESDFDYAVWSHEEQELRAFLLATNRGMTEWFKARQIAAEAEVTQLNPENLLGDEAFNSYMDDTGIFWSDYWERNASMVIRDAFRIYEVFLFDSAHKVLTRYKAGLLHYGTEQSWNTKVCAQFYREYLGLDVLPDELEAAKWIRDMLTHLEDVKSADGKKALEEKRQLLGLSGEVSAEEVKLGLFHKNMNNEFGQNLRFSPLETWRILDAIRNQANVIGKSIHGFVWEKNCTTQALDNLLKGILVNKRISSKRQGDTAFLSVLPVQ